MISFSDRAIKAAQSIPFGRVTTYGRIARAAGGGGMAAQSITAILAKATSNGVKGIPFHRIVYADGRIWINPEHQKSRMALYQKEGISIEKGRVQNLKSILYEFE